MIRTIDLTNLRSDLAKFVTDGWMGRAAVIVVNEQFSAVPEVVIPRSAEAITKCDTEDAQWLIDLSDDELIDYLEERRMINEFNTGRG
jgi:hypothetical protein